MKDRHGYGDEGDFEDSLQPSEPFDPSRSLRRPAPVTKCLVIGTSAAWILQLLLLKFAGLDLAAHLGLVPQRVVGDFELWRLLTMMVVHLKDPLHILFNMFALWVFGREVERSLGTWRFLRFYLLAGLSASLLYLVVHLVGAPFQNAVGASGAIMGILVFFACLHPDARVLAFLLIPMKAKHMVLLLVALDLLFFVVLQAADDGIAHTAHLGGAAFGFLHFRYAPRVRAWMRGYEERHDRRERERERAVRQEVDEILSKISRDGMEALTPRERRFLRDASRRYRDRL